MARQTLSPVAALGQYRFERDGFLINEIPHTRVISIGFAIEDTERVTHAVASRYGMPSPAIGFRTQIQGANSEVPARSLMAMQRDQLWLIGSRTDDEVSLRKVKQLDVPIWLTDQSDAWALLGVSGKHCRAVLERLCPLDIDDNVFTNDHVYRTSFEHMSAIILRNAVDTFCLLTPRSSAHSFVHSLSHAATHVINEAAVRAADEQ